MRIPEINETPKALGQEKRTVTLTIDVTTAHYPLSTKQLTELVEALEYVGVRNLSSGLFSIAACGRTATEEQQKAIMHFFEACYEYRNAHE